MEEFVIYLLKSAGVLCIFVLLYHFLLRRLTFFQANRWFLLMGMLASIAFPLIEITQTVYVEQPEKNYSAQDFSDFAIPVMAESPAEPLVDMSQLALFLYAAISLFFLGKMTVELLSLRRLICSGKRRQEDGFVRISLPRKVTPFSFFKYICFPEKAEESLENYLILKHEQVHAREWHSVDLLLTHIYCAVFWINPLAWWLKKQIGENLEFIADATAKVENTSGISYERTLLSSAASHMQPALANNFFTPFIKKRIQMLQKETSKTWNAYKYALILPVIVLFLYSFNTVTKIEYIKDKTQASNFYEEPLMFDITSKTSQADLDRFVELINDYANFKMDLKMETSDPGNKVFKVYTAFGDKTLFNNFSMELSKDKLVLLEVSKDQARINDTARDETITITAKGTTTTAKGTTTVAISEILYTEDDGTNDVTRSELSKIRFTIPSTTTKESLERIKKTLKTEHNVDFSYGNLKYKEGKIVSINITLDDNRGFKGSQNYNSTDPIDTICITGIINGDSKSWNMGNCDSLGGNIYNYRTKSNNYLISKDSMRQLANLRAFEAHKNFASIDSIYISRIDYKRMKTDSLQLTLKNLQSNLSKLPNDKINLQLKAQLEKAQAQLVKMNMDSLRVMRPSIIELRKSDMDSLRNARTKYVYRAAANAKGGNRDSLFVMRHLKNDTLADIWAYQAPTKERLFHTKSPLFIIDGNPSSEADFRALNPSSIKAVNVLKDGSAITKYGEKAKDGVIEISLMAAKDKVVELSVTDFSDRKMKELAQKIQKEGHSFDMKTFRMKGKEVSKLKFELDGTTYTYEPKNGIKSLTVLIKKDGSAPKVSAVTY